MIQFISDHPRGAAVIPDLTPGTNECRVEDISIVSHPISVIYNYIATFIHKAKPSDLYFINYLYKIQHYQACDMIL